VRNTTTYVAVDATVPFAQIRGPLSPRTDSVASSDENGLPKDKTKKKNQKKGFSEEGAS
jgi:hypothetical protein